MRIAGLGPDGTIAWVLGNAHGFDPSIYIGRWIGELLDDSVAFDLRGAWMTAVHNDSPTQFEFDGPHGARTVLFQPVRQTDCLIVSIPADNPLTDTELRVITALAAGDHATDVARKVGVTRPTIDSHRANIRKKLKLANDVAVGVWAARSGLVDDLVRFFS